MGISEADIRKRKFTQKLKSSTHDTLWFALNELCTYCYEQGAKDMETAMSLHPRIYKPMIEQVKEKAKEICEHWNGIGYIESEAVLEEMYLGNKPKK